MRRGRESKAMSEETTDSTEEILSGENEAYAENSTPEVNASSEESRVSGTGSGDGETDAAHQKKKRKEEKEKKKRSPLSYAIEVVIYIVAIIACVFWVPEYVVQRTVVNGESMENTLHSGESLLVEKVSYHFTDPSRYDIIVFYPQGRDVDEYYVKRIYGLPGETVQIKNNDIYINGEVVADDYAKNAMDDAGIAEEPITLADDEYFVLGDNRKVGLDSRDPDLGPIKAENIAGHVCLRILPFNKFGTP